MRLIQLSEFLGLFFAGFFGLGTTLGGGFAGFFGSCRASLKLVDAAFNVEQFLLAGKERVGGTGNMNFDQWILLAVEGDDVLGCRRGARQKRRAVTEVLEDDGAVSGWMDAFFHSRLITIHQSVTICKLLLISWELFLQHVTVQVHSGSHAKRKDT